MYLKRLGCVLLCGLVLSLQGCDTNTTVSSKSDMEWQWLFDGNSTDAWMQADGSVLKAPWEIVDGALVLTAAGGGDILTRDSFADFELELEWLISEGGNSGIFYRVHSEIRPVWLSGPEYQLLDDANYPAHPDPIQQSASVFDLFPPVQSVAKPAGQWNKTRIRIHNQQVEHWLNDVQVVRYTLGSDDWQQRVAASKFKDFELFGRLPEGHIVLQDHDDVVKFRNIRIRRLD
ncbi:3-keto-disaccharide hydrolase [Alishewanella longhuensis]